MSREAALAIVETVVDKLEDDLVDLRRDLHAHPELSWQERRTTDLVGHHLDEVGWRLTRIGDSGPDRRPRRRATALGSPCGPTSTPSRSTTLTERPVAQPGRRASRMPAGTTSTPRRCSAPAWPWPRWTPRDGSPGRVRLLFQPAEEVMPGGATRLMELGRARRREPDLLPALRPDHRRRPGRAARGADHRSRGRPRRSGSRGSGGHTSRPHLTEDLTFALGKIVTELPAVLSRRLDPRAGVSVVWGRLEAGRALNVIPDAGTLGRHRPDARRGRLERHGGSGSAATSPRSSRRTACEAEVDYERGVPPVVNDPASVALLGRAVDEVLGPTGRAPTAQSLGGEDFAWYLDPGARRDGPARHPRARRPDVRHPPGQPARRRARHGHRRQGAGDRRGRR